MQYQAEIQRAFDLWKNRLDEYELFRDYYDGKHKLRYATAKFEHKFREMFTGFSDNLCETVVDSHVARLQVASLTKREEVQDWLASKRFDALQGDVHFETLLKGDCYVQFWENDAGDVDLFLCEAEYMFPVYDANSRGRMLAAVKLWEDVAAHVIRVTVYYDDRVERYFQRIGSADTINKQAKEPAPRTVALSSLLPFDGQDGRAGDDEDWEQPHEFGVVPVIHFANEASLGKFGRSILQNIIPLQDALNKSVFDLLVNNEQTSLAQRFVSGVEVKIDPKTGEPINPFEGRNLWITPNKDATFGQLPAGDSEALTTVCDQFRREIIRTSATPAYLFGGEFPSGEALRMAEGPLLAKTGRRQINIGNRWEDLVSAALKLPITEMNCVWADTSPRSDLENIMALEGKRRLGVSQTQLQREMGYSEEEIQRNSQEQEAERIAAARAAVMATTRAEQV